jgi:Cd2+/Zn2+-exporting ATPase
METNIQKLEAFEEIAVNFMTKTLTLKLKNGGDVSNVEKKIKAIVNKI